MKTLAQIKTGEKAVVKEIHCVGEGRQRLLDLGLIKGAIIKCSGFAPLGDPMIIQINSFEMAIRKTDAKNIILKKGAEK